MYISRHLHDHSNPEHLLFRRAQLVPQVRRTQGFLSVRFAGCRPMRRMERRSTAGENVCSICLSQYTENEILHVKDACASGEMTEGKKTNKTMRPNMKLFEWMTSRSVVRILNWSDVCELTAVSEKLKRKRWSSSETARDRLFLEKPGIFPPEHAPQRKKTGCR